MYSSPPGHGAAIATAVLSDQALFREWEQELKGMAGGSHHALHFAEIYAKHTTLAPVADDTSCCFVRTDQGDAHRPSRCTDQGWRARRVDPRAEADRHVLIHGTDAQAGATLSAQCLSLRPQCVLNTPAKMCGGLACMTADRQMLGADIAGGDLDQQVARLPDEGRPHQHGRPFQVQLRLPGTGDHRRRPQRVMQSLVDMFTV